MSQPYRIPRTVLARLAAEQYVRSFWWFVGIPPVFGVLCQLSSSRVLVAIGYLGMLWPTTIPIRAYGISSRAAKLFCRSVRVEIAGTTLYFVGDGDSGMKLSLSRVRQIVARHGYVLLIYGIGQFAAIPEALVNSLDDLVGLANSAREPDVQDSPVPS